LHPKESLDVTQVARGVFKFLSAEQLRGSGLPSLSFSGD
jgi:hypothetical protein